MNRIRFLALVLVAAALASFCSGGLLAAEGSRSTGSIQGRVKNAVTGQYLNNARVTVAGTDIVTFTDQTGGYQVVGVPRGPVTLEVFYTDLDVQRIPIDVAPGQVATRDVELTSVSRYGADPNVVRINPYVVISEKEADAAALATNEQRFAPNLKNVVSTDSLGDTTGNNVGEFLKFLPGITGEYSGNEIIGISVRGFSGGMTAFTSNGAPMVGAFFLGGVAGGGRDFNINIMGMNDISRVEVTKVPTPSMPADSIGGAVNMISKSAFERSKPEIRVGLNLNANHENLTLSQTPHSNGDRNTRKILPGYDFDYTLPINKRFGLVIGGMQNERFNEQHHSTLTWSGAGTATAASLDRPYLQSYALIDSPRTQIRTRLSLGADWRVTLHSVLSLSTQVNRYKNYIGALTWTFSPGTIGTPTPATGTPMQFGPDFVTGATGRGAVTMSGGGQTFGGDGSLVSLSYRLDDGTWRIEAGLSHSVSEIYRRNAEAGHFSTIGASLSAPARVSFAAINPVCPGKIEVFGNNSQPVDVYDIRNYVTTTATDQPVHNRALVKAANLSVQRRAGFLPFPASLQLGGAHRIQSLDARRENITWTHFGPDGNAATADPAAPYLMQTYVSQDSHYGFRNIPWVSPNRAWAAWQENPGLFASTPAQRVAAETFRIANSEFIEESVSALYLQAEVRLLANRLRILGGVRWEKTVDEGEGMLFDPNAVFVRNANGTFARNAQGVRLRRADAGAAGSMEELRLTRQERLYTAKRTYDGYYPSLHVTHQFKENLQLRLAYAKTYGRPAFTDIIPSATINELDLGADLIDDPTVAKGTITVRNTGLLPWTADNYDLSLEYYTDHGGVLSGGLFLKEIRDFFGDSVRLATAGDLDALGLDSRYIGWNLATTFNSGDARIRGAEVNIRHSLRALGKWGRHFTVFANGTKLDLEGSKAAAFTSFITESANWGFSFSRQRLACVVKWNYRGQDKRVPQPLFGPDGYEYFKARTYLDLNLIYSLTRNLSIVANANNVFNVPQTILRYGSDTPAHARQWRRSEFGTSITVGIKGTF